MFDGRLPPLLAINPRIWLCSHILNSYDGIWLIWFSGKPSVTA